MTRHEPKTDQSLVPLAITSVVAFALAGVAVLVSANTQLPVYPASPQVDARSAFNTAQDRLEANLLKKNALSALRSLPVNNATLPSAVSVTKPLTRPTTTPVTLPVEATITDAVNASAAESNAINRQAALASVNVNTFLLSNRINNESKLAELQMQHFFGDVDAQEFANVTSEVSAPVSVQTVTDFHGVGFPHIETSDREYASQYKPYKQLVSFNNKTSGVIVPNVKCMGLSAERVANRAKKYDAKIFDLAVRYKVSASLVKAVVAKESCFNPKALSPVGAIGLMQLMPETAQWLKVTKPENVDQNLKAGVRYLAQLRKRFGTDELALAAYNAGPGNVERYKGIPPFAETQNYVQDVMHFYRGYVATTRFVNAQNEI